MEKVTNEELLFTYNDEDLIYWLETPGRKGEYLFSFDKKIVFNFFQDYPQKLTADQIAIFKKENPELAALK